VGLILDSSVVIAAERRGDTPQQLATQIARLAGDQEAALSAVGLTELVHGIYRADSAERRKRRQQFVNELRAGFSVHPYTDRTALLAGRIDGEQAAKGIIVPFPDLLIGATALSLGFSVATVNLRHFRLIPGLSVISL
jgi:predicted nucleic acid-binding protein